MLFWNVAKVKLLSQDTWKCIRKFDIVELMETWTEDKDEKLINTQLERYKTSMRPATKEKRRGRAKEGMIMAVRKEIRSISCETACKEIIGERLEIEGQEVLVMTTYKREEKAQNWKEIEVEIEKKVI